MKLRKISCLHCKYSHIVFAWFWSSVLIISVVMKGQEVTRTISQRLDCTSTAGHRSRRELSSTSSRNRWQSSYEYEEYSGSTQVSCNLIGGQSSLPSRLNAGVFPLFYNVVAHTAAANYHSFVRGSK